MVCDPVKVSLLFDQCSQCPLLKNIVKIGKVQQAELDIAGRLGLTIVSMDEVEVEFCYWSDVEKLIVSITLCRMRVQLLHYPTRYTESA